MFLAKELKSAVHIVEEFSDRVVVNLHGTNRAEFLAAEAFDTLAAVD